MERNKDDFTLVKRTLKKTMKQKRHKGLFVVDPRKVSMEGYVPEEMDAVSDDDSDETVQLKKENEMLKQKIKELTAQLQGVKVQLEDAREEARVANKKLIDRFEEQNKTINETRDLVKGFAKQSKNQEETRMETNSNEFIVSVPAETWAENTQTQMTPRTEGKRTSKPQREKEDTVEPKIKKVRKEVEIQIQKDKQVSGPSKDPKSTPIPTPTRHHIPPIILKSVDEWKHLIRGLKSRQVKYQSKISNNGNSVKLTAEDPNSYRAIGNYFEEYKKSGKNINWVIYELPENKPFKAVMKGIPHNFEIQDIKEDLETNDVKIIDIKNMTSRKPERAKLQMFLITVPKEDKEKILKIKGCLNMVVTIEEQRRSTRPVQCYKCQGFYHAQSHCNCDEKCVRCGENHRAAECPRDRAKEATCANCGGPHPANYSGCSKMPKKANPIRQNTRTYASIASKPKAVPQQQPQIDIRELVAKIETFQKIMLDMSSMFGGLNLHQMSK